ncbi:MAG TPA: PQQ-binding-like beta-propeller repeat protein [Candidatus Dormibacteraeota bacterium]|jgi:DNA-binding beta-propeller fold protein YncE|nr:PQQ-binding-like beta-propeller repeat protein [Candidatus Dormibacteraeota bacterium]
MWIPDYAYLRISPSDWSTIALASAPHRLVATAVLILVFASACSLPGTAIAKPSPSPGSAILGDPDQERPVPIVSIQPSPILGNLVAQGDPNALPGHLLISDRGNSRVIELDPTGQIVWQFPPPGYKGTMPFDQPDDAFYSPFKDKISTNEEFEHTIQVIDKQTNTVTWTYGTPYQTGSGPNHLNGPDDAFLLPDGRLIAADIMNCRVVFIKPDATTTQVGHTGVCRHDPANGYLAAPNGDAPDSTYLHLVVTEIQGSYVDVFSLTDLTLEYSFHSPATYPSDAELQPDGTFILTDYVTNGSVYRVDKTGKLLWSYSVGLDHPSIALGLPNGFVCVSDDYGNRVQIIDPATNKVVWQYGVKNVPGATAGHLNTPDGLDFLPPPDTTP